MKITYLDAKTEEFNSLHDFYRCHATNAIIAVNERPTELDGMENMFCGICGELIFADEERRELDWKEIELLDYSGEYVHTNESGDHHCEITFKQMRKEQHEDHLHD